MFRLVHLSDPHLGPLPGARLRDLASKRILGYANWHRSRYRFHRTDVLEAVVAHVRGLGADHIAVTGDLVNIALPGEFEAARHWLDTLGAPGDISVTPGNHDAYVAFPFDEGIGRWEPYMESDPGLPVTPGMFPFVRRRDGVSLIGLSTGVPAPFFKATGLLGADQIDRFETVMAEERDAGQMRVVLMHHPPYPDGTPIHKRLLDGSAFLEALARVGADLVLYGHNHRYALAWLEGPDNTIPAVGVPSASAAVTDTGGEGGGHLFTIEPSATGTRIHLERFGADGRTIRQVAPAIRLDSEDQATVTALLKASSGAGLSD
ncbi:MAG: metallophosphoesterase [Rhodobiaceae bacterium]|nr:metallophosphoesterase [Rhodobiaceae bacterium]